MRNHRSFLKEKENWREDFAAVCVVKALSSKGTVVAVLEILSYVLVMTKGSLSWLDQILFAVTSIDGSVHRQSITRIGERG